MRKAVLLLVVLLASMTPAFAWGPRGHQVVAHIAALNLSPRARAAVADLMGGPPEALMALQANWADEVRDRRPETGPWHYVNLRLGGDMRYREARDCPQAACIVAKIAWAETVLRGDARRPRKVEALKYLIHFMGDIQQPLHAADNNDRGGNRVFLRWRGQRITLHHFWDDEMVALHGRDPLAIARAIDRETPAAQKAAMGAGTQAAWAERSAAIARDSIYPMAGRTPDQAEAARYARIARTQLARGGYALAARLNAIFR